MSTNPNQPLPLSSTALAEALTTLKHWHLNDQNQLTKTVPFPTFSDGLAFTNALGAIADTLNHHPDILLQWGRVRITIWTHAVGALTDLDVEFARQVDRLN